MKRYTADISIGSITFDTIDVIRGVITGAKWLNLNPHNNIFKILLTIIIFLDKYL